jgi:hypothetical protein
MSQPIGLTGRAFESAEEVAAGLRRDELVRAAAAEMQERLSRGGLLT